MTLFAGWCAAEEMYVLTPNVAAELQKQLGELQPSDDNHKQLLTTTTTSLRLFLESNSYHDWDRMDLWRLDSSSRWVLNQIVRPAFKTIRDVNNAT